MDKRQSVVTYVSDDSDARDVFMFSVHFRRPLRVAMKESVTWNLWKRPCLQKYCLFEHTIRIPCICLNSFSVLYYLLFSSFIGGHHKTFKIITLSHYGASSKISRLHQQSNSGASHYFHTFLQIVNETYLLLTYR